MSAVESKRVSAVVRTIAIKGSERQFACDEDDVILRAALRSGLGFPYECNSGSCGNCRFELIEGQVEHAWAEAPGWSERDRKRNRYLGCQSHPRGDCTIKVRLDPKYVGAYRPIRSAAAVERVVPVTHDITEFTLKLDEAQAFLPGQYALIGLAGVEGMRAYSMSNIAAGARVDRWSFMIKRVPGGALTSRLFEGVDVGDRVSLEGPFGLAYLRPEVDRDVLLIAGGSGLSPMVSIARAATGDPAFGNRHIHFFYGGRGPRDICGREFLEELPGWDERLHYYPAISETGHADWQGYVGFVHDFVREKFAERLKDHEVYFAGPPAMAEAVQRMLFEAAVPGEQVHFDQFY